MIVKSTSRNWFRCSLDSRSRVAFQPREAGVVRNAQTADERAKLIYNENVSFLLSYSSTRLAFYWPVGRGCECQEREQSMGTKYSVFIMFDQQHAAHGESRRFSRTPLSSGVMRASQHDRGMRREQVTQDFREIFIKFSKRWEISIIFAFICSVGLKPDGSGVEAYRGHTGGWWLWGLEIYWIWSFLRFWIWVIRVSTPWISRHDLVNDPRQSHDHLHIQLHSENK